MRSSPNSDLLEESLDPEDWEALRSLGHRMVDDMLAYLRSVRERPVWQVMPAHVRAAFEKPLPRAPQKPAEVYRDFQENVLP